MIIDEPLIKNKYNINKNDPYTGKENFGHYRTLQLTSRFGNEKILNDPSLNKYYKSYLSKEEQKIKEASQMIQLIEQMDNKKYLDFYKNQFLSENHKRKIFEKRNKIYKTNYVNLDNFKQKLDIQNKINDPDSQFMLSLMSHIASKPKKIIKQKIYHKLEELSKQKHFKKRKSVECESPINSKRSKRNSLIILLKNGSINPYEKNLNTINVIKNIQSEFSEINSPEFKIKNKNVSNTNFNNNKFILNNNDNFDEVAEFDSLKQNLNNPNTFNQTSSTNFGLTKYNKTFLNFNIKQDSNKSLNKNDNSSVNSNTSKKSNSENNTKDNFNQKSNKFNKKSFEQNKKINPSSSNNIKNSKNNENNNIDTSNSNSHFSDEKDNILQENKNTKKTKNKENSKKNEKTYYSRKKTIKRIATYSSSDESSSKKLKFYDKNLIYKKLCKKYNDTMGNFIQQIKNEEKDIRSNIILMSDKLFRVKKEHQKFFCVNDNIYKDEIRSYTFKKKLHKSKIKKSQLNKKIEAEVGNTDFIGKSKYSLPTINKVIYGKIGNTKDQFEKIQDELLKEVRKQYKKINSSRKKEKINGKEILDKITTKNLITKIPD